MQKLKKAIIVDLDGTLTNCDHRLSHLRKSPKDWDAFFLGMGEDELHEWCAQLISSMSKSGHAVILLTGRPDEYRELTTKWLAKHEISYDHLLMRKTDDHRSDSEVKWELYQQAVAPRYQVLFCVEDRASVVAMWRENGIRTLQCDLGDF